MWLYENNIKTMDGIDLYTAEPITNAKEEVFEPNTNGIICNQISINKRNQRDFKNIHILNDKPPMPSFNDQQSPVIISSQDEEEKIEECEENSNNNYSLNDHCKKELQWPMKHEDTLQSFNQNQYQNNNDANETQNDKIINDLTCKLPEQKNNINIIKKMMNKQIENLTDAKKANNKENILKSKAKYQLLCRFIRNVILIFDKKPRDKIAENKILKTEEWEYCIYTKTHLIGKDASNSARNFILKSAKAFIKGTPLDIRKLFKMHGM